MIKIDLGKDEFGKSGSEKNVLFKLIGHLLGGSKSGFAIVLGLLLAFLPHLFFTQYQDFQKNTFEAQMKAYKEKEEALKIEIAKYSSIQKEFDSYEKQKKFMLDRLVAVKALLQARNTPVNTLDAIGQGLPQRAWLTFIEYNSSPNPKITLTGKAYTNEDISDFVDKLSESIHLTEVALQNVTTGLTENNVELKSFDVGAFPRVQDGLPVNPSEIPRQTANEKASK